MGLRLSGLDSVVIGGLKTVVASSSGGQRNQHRSPGPIPHSGAAQGPAGGHAVSRAISSRKHHHPLQDLLPRTPEPVRVPGKHIGGSFLVQSTCFLRGSREPLASHSSGCKS